MVDMKKYVDAIGRFSQAGGIAGVLLVRIKSHETSNRYKAAILEMNSSWSLSEVAGADQIDVMNVCESDDDEHVDNDTDAVAIDVEGRWIVFIRKATGGALLIPAKVVSSSGGASYELELLGLGEDSEFAATETTVSATNLAEMNLGPGGAVDIDSIVLLTEIKSSDGGSGQYFFDHPTYAKYLD